METNKVIGIAGRIALAVPFLMFGMGHLTGADKMSMMVPSWLPGGVFWVYLTGLAELAAALSLVSGFFTKWAGLGIAVLMLTYVLTIHLPTMMNGPDEMTKMMGFMGVMKDTGLLGGGLLAASLTWNK